MSSPGAVRQGKLLWSGRLLGVQPRIDLVRSFDQRQHDYLGYLLLLDGLLGDRAGRFSLRIGPAAHAKHGFRAGMVLRGQAQLVVDSDREVADAYKVSQLQVVESGASVTQAPPWLGAPPPLAVYRERGHRRLNAATYDSACGACQWGCRMLVTLIVDQWNPAERRYRFETFCYGPKSCALYRAGPTRKVPGRKGTSWEEEDWVDHETTAHRGPED
jgi:hypothetical protein